MVQALQQGFSHPEYQRPIYSLKPLTQRTVENIYAIYSH